MEHKKALWVEKTYDEKEIRLTIEYEKETMGRKGTSIRSDGKKKFYKFRIDGVILRGYSRFESIVAG